MTLSTDDKTRFLEALRDDPEFLQQVRQHVLIADLLELPERFAAFASTVTSFMEQQLETNARLDERLTTFMEQQHETNARLDERLTTFMEQQRETNARVDERLDTLSSTLSSFKEQQRETNARVDERLDTLSSTLSSFKEQQREINVRADEHFARTDTRLQQITDDVGDLKGHVAGRVAREMADDIAERFGFEMIEVLNGQDLRQMLRQHNPADIAPGVRRSFYLADMVGRVIDQQGNEFFLATEASYTADQRDSDRAIRNAEFLTRFTGMSAMPVVASRHNDREVQRLVEAGTIRWFEFDQRDLTPQ